MLLFLAPAFAIDLDSYRLAGAPWEAGGSLGLTGAEVGRPGTWSLGVAGVFANEPAPGHLDALDSVRMAFGVVPLKNLRVELEVPAHPGLLGADGWRSGVGDPELRARMEVGKAEVAGHELHVAIEPVVSFPNGDAALGVGAGSLSGGVTVPAGLRVDDRFRVDAQVAVLAAPPAVVGDVQLGSWFGYGAGVTWDAPHDLHVSGELTGRVDLEGEVEGEDTPLDLGVGVAWAKESGFGAALGGSVGLLEGPGAPAQRLVLTVGWLQPGPARAHRAAATACREGEDDEDVADEDVVDEQVAETQAPARVAARVDEAAEAHGVRPVTPPHVAPAPTPTPPDPPQGPVAAASRETEPPKAPAPAAKPPPAPVAAVDAPVVVVPPHAEPAEDDFVFDSDAVSGHAAPEEGEDPPEPGLYAGQ